MPTTRKLTVLLSTLSLGLALSACDDSKKESKPSGDKADAAKKDDDKADKADDKAEDKAADADKAKDDAKQDDAAKPDDTKVAAAEAEPAPAPEAEAKEDAAAPPPPAAPGAAGPAYFLVDDRGIVKLDGGKFTELAGSPKLLTRHIRVERDGNVYLLGPDGVMRIEGDNAAVIAKTSYDSTGSLDAYALTKDAKTIWGVGYKGISQWDGTGWKTEEKKVLGDDVSLLKGIVVDDKDQVWVASSNKLHTRDGDKWVDVDTSKVFDRQPFFDSMALGPEGVAYALAGSGLAKVASATEVSKVALATDRFPSLGMLAFAEGGNMGLKSNHDEVMLVQGDAAKKWKKGTDFAAEYIRAVTVDGQGRMWVASDIGLAILGPADAKAEWNSGSVLELAGQIDGIAVVGAGPELPTVGEVKKAGLKGKILTDGKGLAETEVEICPSPSMLFEKSPCAESPVNFSGKTDADGSFAFDGVPIGAYGVAVKVGGKWQLSFSSNFGTRMKEGEAYDMGSLKVKAPK